MEITRARSKVVKLQGTVHVDGKLVADAEIMFSRVDRPGS